jgi:hypothetical protein
MTHHFGNMVDLWRCIFFWRVRLASATDFTGDSVDDVIRHLLVFFFAF